MYLKEQIYILEIYKQQSLSKAAQHLHISQPALSNYLNHLEQNLGIALFVREKRRLVPTEAGTIYIDIAARMVRLQETFYLRLKPLLETAPCVLGIGIQRIRGASMIPKILQFFAERYPEIKVEFLKGSFMELLSGLESDDLDLLFGYHIPSLYPASRYKNYSIARDTLYLAVSENRRDSVPSDFSRLSDETFILHPNTQSERFLENEFLKENHIVPEKIIEEDTMEVILRMATMNMGICLIAGSYIKYYRAPGIYFYPTDCRYKTLDFCMFTKKMQAAPKYLEELAAFTRNIF